MTLRIERASDGHSTTIRLIGRMQGKHLDNLKTQIKGDGSGIVLDLEEVSLVDVEVVRFLGTCEARGATLLHCTPYIRDWIGKKGD
jgi:anti-anti-sigma regulatory factor